MKPQLALRPLLILAALRLLLHALTNSQYGFHRDELQTLDDARHLAWGFVAYPPVTPFIARCAFALFGASPVGIRSFTALAQAIVMVLAGLMARELNGSRSAQILAALAVAAAPVSLVAGHLFQYVSFDLLWSVLATYFVMKLLHTQDPRWWLAVGASVGLGLMTRYTIAWLVGGLLIGFLLTPARALLASRWFAAAVALAFVIALPNLIWQANHSFITLDFLKTIHARDLRIGRADGFLWKQFFVPAAVCTVPLWIAGLVFYFKKTETNRYRVLGWAFFATLILFAAARGRDYYTAPLYPMLLAAGAVIADTWHAWQRRIVWILVAVALLTEAPFLLPFAPVNSRWFQAAAKVNGDIREEIGWPDLVNQIARIRDSLPATDRGSLGILTVNYGEAGAVNLYGASVGLPPAISRANSLWLRGYGNPPPETLIVVGYSPNFVKANFQSCAAQGTVANRFGIHNEETDEDTYLWVCRGLRQPWPIFWKRIPNFQ